MTLSATGANLPALRSHNAALVLGLLRAEAVASGGGVSRRELAERTGLTPQAVSKITARLRAEGLVEDAGRRASTGGKPPTELRLAAGARYAVGVHLDGVRLTAVLTDLAGRTVADRTAPLDLGRPVGDGLAAITAEVLRTAALAPGPVLGAGVGVRGPLDHTSGVLHRVTGFPHWEGTALRTELAHRLALPVTVDKDTNTAALALLTHGTRPPAPGTPGGSPPGPPGTRPADSFAYLHLGTGLGAALVLGGALYRGGRTGAGEFGHQAVQLDGPLCGCGNRGCLEALCLAAVAAGDLRGAARLLGVGAANLAALLDIDRVVLGGGTVGAAPELFRAEVSGVLATRGRPLPVAGSGPLAAAEGAALLALAPLFPHAPLT